MFPKLALLNRHYINNHPPMKCLTCDKAFNCPSSLEQHLYLHKNLRYQCDVCGTKFPFESTLKSHKITHLTERPHKCNFKKCTKSFYNIGDLRKHKKVHLGEDWKCTICEYVSKDKCNLKAHMRKHSNLKPYICASCLRLFKYHTQLKRHLPCEIKVKTLQCSKSPNY